jgi:hypothetical protein
VFGWARGDLRAMAVYDLLPVLALAASLRSTSVNGLAVGSRRMRTADRA